MKVQFEPIVYTANHVFNSHLDTKKEFDYPFHYHPELELTYVLSSNGTRYVGNNFEDFEVNDLVIVGSNLPHCWKNHPGNTEPATALVLQWREDCAGREWESLIEFEKIKDLHRLAQKGIKYDERMALHIKDKLISVHTLPPFKRYIAFLEVLNELAECKDYQILCDQCVTYNLNLSDNARISTVYQYVQNHYKEKITLKMISAEVNMTEESFSRFFSKMMKKGFFTYLNEYRINIACQMLIETDKQVAEICYHAGYESISFFYRQFKKVKNCSPQYFRIFYNKVGNYQIPA